MSINRKILALILFILSIIIASTIKKKKAKSIYKNQVFYLMIGFGVIYLIVFYLMGLYFGYYEAPAKFGLKTIFNFILPFMVIIISSEIMSNPNDYNAAILDKDPDEYCEWILKGDSWGGGIELSILSKFFQMQIGVVDIQNITIEYFGDYSNCIYLLYN